MRAGGWTIKTTLDLRAQKIAEDFINETCSNIINGNGVGKELEKLYQSITTKEVK